MPTVLYNTDTDREWQRQAPFCNKISVLPFAYVFFPPLHTHFPRAIQYYDFILGLLLL